MHALRCEGGCPGWIARQNQCRWLNPLLLLPPWSPRGTHQNLNTKSKKNKAPSKWRSRVFAKTDTFFSEYIRLPSTRKRFSNTLSRVETFENGDSLYPCGRTKTEVFKYDDVIPRFDVHSSAHTIRKRYVWLQIFLNTEKKTLRFSKIPGHVCTVKYDSKTLRLDAGFVLNTEGNLSVFENTGLRVDEG